MPPFLQHASARFSATAPGHCGANRGWHARARLHRLTSRSQGKPNGGKSTLFNRLVGNNRALVTPTPGTTRDRLYGPMQWPLLDKVVDVVDTGGMYHDEDFFWFVLFCSASLCRVADTHRSTEVTEQAQLAIDEAHMVLLVVDGRAPLDDKDRRVARILRVRHHPVCSTYTRNAQLTKRNKTKSSQQRHLSTRPVLLVVNKVDNDRMLAELQERSHAAYRNLGLGDPLYVSALHAEGTTELQTTIFQLSVERNPQKRYRNKH